MSKTLFINNATAVPAASTSITSPADVAEARIAAFNADDFSTGTLDLNAPIPEGVKRVVFVQGGEQPIISSIVNVEDVKEVSKRAYVAPTPQVTTVTVEEGERVAELKIVKVSDGYEPNQTMYADVIIDGKTADEIAAEFAAKLNAISPSFATVTASTADIVITGDTGVSFETALDGEAAGWTISATAPNFGSGTSEQIKNIEEVAWGGNYPNRIYFPLPPKSYVENSNYDVNTVLVRTNTTANISKSNKYQELIFAVQTAQSGIDLEKFFFGKEEAGG